MLGVNKTAGLLLREAVARGAEGLSGERSLFFRYPTVLLSTCNRTEIYFSAPDLAEAHHSLLSFLRGRISTPFERRLYSFFGLDCFIHLGRVVSGLDSAILGESEIQRQVKNAYRHAMEVLALPAVMHYSFQKALRIGKKVRGLFLLKRGAPSLESTLWHWMEEEKATRRVLLIGLSEIHRTLALFLQKKGVSEIAFCSRSPEKIPPSYRAFSREALPDLCGFDTISCATRAQSYLLEEIPSGARLLFDLSVPRTIHPDLGNRCRLYNIEQVDERIEQKREAFGHSLQECEELILEEATRLSDLYARKQKESYAVEL